MSMEPTTSSQRTRDYPRTPDGKYKYTASDGSPLHFEPTTIPALVGDGFQMPPSLTNFRKLLQRKDAPDEG
jgi:hypothetical protein